MSTAKWLISKNLLKHVKTKLMRKKENSDSLIGLVPSQIGKLKS